MPTPPPEQKPSPATTQQQFGISIEDAKRALESLKKEQLSNKSPEKQASFPSHSPRTYETYKTVANQHQEWIFRCPDNDPLEIGVQYKSMALSSISNTNQTFTMTILEDVAIWLTQEEYEEYCNCPDLQSYRPRHFIELYVYNSSEHEWKDANRTVEGCEFHIRDVYNDKRCWAFRQRQGKITFHQPFDLKFFPFDVQDLTCMFALYTYTNLQDAQKLIVKPMYGGTTFSARFVAPNDEYHVFFDHRDFQECNGYVRCTYKIVRCWKYYFWKVVLVLAIVTLTALAAFVSFDSFMDQMSHLSTVLLTDVAYLYTVSEHMPRLQYLTLLDICVFGNIAFVFAIFIQLTLVEILDVDVMESRGTLGGTIRDKMLLGNFLGWLGSGLLFTCICFACRRYELKKLGQPYDEKELESRRHDAINLNTDFHARKEMNVLLLKRNNVGSIEDIT